MIVGHPDALYGSAVPSKIEQSRSYTRWIPGSPLPNVKASDSVAHSVAHDAEVAFPLCHQQLLS
jgi:hypothetical protein